mmetsp:Transcript_77786/g.216090  ORF Transcript_77786/g.216090 Transcript_77786/m.216090 type:complete len:195 (+) Transcript_77786:103-687(+)
MQFRVALGFFGVVVYVVVLWQQWACLDHYKHTTDTANATVSIDQWQPGPALSYDCKNMYENVRDSWYMLSALASVALVALALRMLVSCACACSERAKEPTDGSWRPAAWTCAMQCLAFVQLAFGLALIIMSLYGLFKLLFRCENCARDCTYLHHTALWTLLADCFLGDGMFAIGVRTLCWPRLGRSEARPLLMP